MKKYSFLLTLVAAVIVVAGLVWDHNAHGGATWISYVLFFGALAYVAMVVIRAIANGIKPPKGPTAVALLLLTAAATSCATGTDLSAEQKREELTAATWETRTYTDAQGFNQTVAVR